VIIWFIAHNSMNTTSQCTYILQVNTYSIYHIHSVSITMVKYQSSMLSHLMNHIHFTYKLCNTHNYSIVFKIILTRHTSKWFNSSGSHNGSHHNTRRAKTRCPYRVLKLCDCIVHNSQLNTYNISIHMYLTINHRFNLSLTHNLNHHFIISI